MKDSFSRREHIGWVDLLRVLACFLVVFAHCCDPFVGQLDADRGAFLTGAFAGSLVRCSVPLFVMMTGVLLLPVGEGMGAFYRRRIGRIVPPLLFWSLALPLLFFAYLHTFGAATQSPTVDPASYTVRQLVVRLYTFVFNFNYDTTPLWYLYMLVGLYLVMPVLGAWLRQASQRDLQLFLAVWGAALLLPYVEVAAPLLGYAGNGGNMGLWGVCDWNAYGTFYYFSGFVGYLVLAYYLVRYPLRWSWRRTLGVMAPLFAVGYLITALGFVATQNRFPGNFAYLEIVWYFCGINVFASGVAHLRHLSVPLRRDPRVLRPARLHCAARLGAARGDERRGLRRERARRLGDEPLERHAARGDVTGAFLQSQRAGPRRGRPVLPIGRRFSPP